MVTPTIEDTIAKCGLLKNLDPKWQGRLAADAQRRQYKKGSVIFRQGQECPGLYIVGSGVVRIYKIAPNGKEHVLHFAQAGMTFAEIAVIGGFACPAYAETAEDSVCVIIPTDRFQYFLRSDHEFCLNFIQGMAYWVRQTIGLLEDIVLRDAAGRVANHLLHMDQESDQGIFVLPVLKKDLASHLNLTGEALSRTLRRLEESGLIEMPDNHRVRILQNETLRKVANGELPGGF